MIYSVSYEWGLVLGGRVSLIFSIVCWTLPYPYWTYWPILIRRFMHYQPPHDRVSWDILFSSLLIWLRAHFIIILNFNFKSLMAKGKRKSRKAKKTVRPFKCKYCFKHFASMPSRSKHHANIHFEIHSVMRYTRAIKGIECKLCSRRYSCK